MAGRGRRWQITNRSKYENRLKRSQQPVEVQRHVQWAALMRRSQRAARDGRVSCTQLARRAVVDNDEVGKIRVRGSTLRNSIFGRPVRWLQIFS